MVTDPYEDAIINVFNENHKVYGARKIKAFLAKENIYISRRMIRRIMKKNVLESVYQIKRYKNHNKAVNEQKIANILDREFDNRNEKEVIVSDLTYVRVENNWHYICILLDLFNREIV